MEAREATELREGSDQSPWQAQEVESSSCWTLEAGTVSGEKTWNTWLWKHAWLPPQTQAWSQKLQRFPKASHEGKCRTSKPSSCKKHGKVWKRKVQISTVKPASDWQKLNTISKFKFYFKDKYVKCYLKKVIRLIRVEEKGEVSLWK